MSKTVMVVDDSASVRQVVGLALRGAGYTVIEDVDGVDALSKSIGQKVHKIISDLNMPTMDGINDDIAYQTNMLALNAAIEATRAGELIDEIVPGIGRKFDLVQEIAASQKQSTGVGQCNSAMKQMSKNLH